MRSVPPALQATGPIATRPRIPIQRHNMRMWYPNKETRRERLGLASWRVDASSNALCQNGFFRAQF